MGDGIQRYAPCDECSCLDMRDGEGAYVLFTDHESAVAAAVEERDSEWRERIESGRPLIFNHRGAVAPAVTTSAGVTPAEVEDENLD